MRLLLPVVLAEKVPYHARSVHRRVTETVSPYCGAAAKLQLCTTGDTLCASTHEWVKQRKPLRQGRFCHDYLNDTDRLVTASS